jgi:transposase-like protein
MARRRKLRSEQDGRRCVAAMKASGLSRREWARQHGVDGRSLYAWEKKVGSDEPDPVRERLAGLVELIPALGAEEGRFVVQCGRFAVEVDAHFDEATLGRLLKVVAAC